MWETKFFKTLEEANNFINKNDRKYQTQLIYVHNGFAVEYKKLKKILIKIWNCQKLFVLL